MDETVQRRDGVLVIDATAIYDSMLGASGPLAMEEKRTFFEMMGIQEGTRGQIATTEKQISGMDEPRKRQRRSWNASMAIDVSGVLSMTKKRSVPENVDNKANNP